MNTKETAAVMGANLNFRAQICLNSVPNYTNLIGLEAVAGFTGKPGFIAPHSNFLKPIIKLPSELSGYGRGFGQATTETQYQIMARIMEHSALLPRADQALLLAIAKVESGFNPDAAAATSSASGVFQLVKKTADNLGVSQTEVFDADKNIMAGIRLFEENRKLVADKYPNLSGNERAVMLYAIHHDGPGLQYGGEKLGRELILPELAAFQQALLRQEWIW